MYKNAIGDSFLYIPDTHFVYLAKAIKEVMTDKDKKLVNKIGSMTNLRHYAFDQLGTILEHKNAIDFKIERDLLNTPKGLFDIRALRLVPFTNESFPTMMTAASFCDELTFDSRSQNLTEDLRKFYHLLEDSFGNDKTRVTNCIMLLASILQQGPKRHRAVFLLGPDHITQMITTILKTCLGSYCASVDSEEFTVKRTNEDLHRQLCKVLKVARVLLVPFFSKSKNKRVDTFLLEKICTGELITLRQSNKGIYQFRGNVTIVMYGENVPEFSDYDISFLRENLLLIPLVSPFSKLYAMKETKIIDPFVINNPAGFMTYFLRWANRYIIDSESYGSKILDEYFASILPNLILGRCSLIEAWFSSHIFCARNDYELREEHEAADLFNFSFKPWQLSLYNRIEPNRIITLDLFAKELKKMADKISYFHLQKRPYTSNAPLVYSGFRVAENGYYERKRKGKIPSIFSEIYPESENTKRPVEYANSAFLFLSSLNENQIEFTPSNSPAQIADASYEPPNMFGWSG